MPHKISRRFKRPLRMLTNIKWKETSGVDEPANEEEGWIIMKMKELGDELDEVLKAEAERVEKQEQLYAILAAIDWNEAPYEKALQDIKAAVQTILGWLETEGYGKAGDYGYVAPNTEGDECICPSCGTKVAHQLRTPCNEVDCPKCDTKMVRVTKTKDNKVVSRKSLMNAIFEAIKKVFSRKHVYKLADEKVMKAIKQYWGEFCKNISFLVKSVDKNKNKQILGVLDTLETNIRNTLNEEGN